MKGGGARVLQKCETKRKEGRSVLALGALYVSRQVAAPTRGPLGYGVHAVKFRDRATQRLVSPTVADSQG